MYRYIILTNIKVDKTVLCCTSYDSNFCKTLKRRSIFQIFIIFRCILHWLFTNQYLYIIHNSYVLVHCNWFVISTYSHDYPGITYVFNAKSFYSSHVYIICSVNFLPLSPGLPSSWTRQWPRDDPASVPCRDPGSG